MCPEAQPPGQHLEEMRIVVAAAVAARVDTLVLSSENLSLADSQRMREYATILDGHEVVLIYGLMPFHSRARSWWQELIKNGHTKPSREISAILLKTKFLRSGVLTQYSEALNPSRIAIVCSQHGNPADCLIKRCLQAMELPLGDSSAGLMGRHHNRSLSRFETEVLRLNNLVGEVVPYWPAARIRRGLFRRFSSEGWPRILPGWTLRLSPETADLIEEHSKGVHREIEILGGQRSVTVYGQFDGKS